MQLVAGKSKNGGEKTFVIIIGLLAGLAVLVIFLAFLKSICTRSHGNITQHISFSLI